MPRIPKTSKPINLEYGEAILIIAFIVTAAIEPKLAMSVVGAVIIAAMAFGIMVKLHDRKNRKIIEEREEQ